MGLPSRFFEKKFVKDEKGDDITPFDGTVLSNIRSNSGMVIRYSVMSKKHTKKKHKLFT
jgi:hypothetical protein